jgi:hypothetical protein
VQLLLGFCEQARVGGARSRSLLRLAQAAIEARQTRLVRLALTLVSASLLDQLGARRLQLLGELRYVAAERRERWREEREMERDGERES